MRSTAQDLRQWQTVIISSMQDLQTDRESTSEITFSSLAGKDIVIETENKIPVTTLPKKSDFLEQFIVTGISYFSVLYFRCLHSLTFLYKSRAALRTSYFNFPFALRDADFLFT